MAAQPQISAPLSYTANPLLLIFNDVILFLQITFTWPITAGLLSTVLPFFPLQSGALDELGFSIPNYWDVALHTILIITQVLFLLSLIPFAFLGLPLFYFLYVVGFVVGNKWFTVLLNGPRRNGLFQSHPDCVKGKATHDKEKWVFINGVSVGSHWLQSNLDLLAMTFRRPVYGIHNQTRGIIFDVLECIIQRDLGFATTDIRDAYKALVDILSAASIEKVVLILHSQGGIEGGLVLDWLYDTVPADQLRKLEIYTFGNAANHWNAPVISTSKAISNSTKQSGSNKQRIVQHIEHYANEGDYVSKFGVLHFRPDQDASDIPAPIPHDTNDVPPPPPVPDAVSVPSGRVPPSMPAPTGADLPPIQTQLRRRTTTWTHTPQTPMEHNGLGAAEQNNRFFGRLFKRASSGHLLNMHYLDKMFEMRGVNPNDRSMGEVKEDNAFMSAPADIEVFQHFDTVQAYDPGLLPEPRAGGKDGSAGPQIKKFSRLWGYRNGRSPAD